MITSRVIRRYVLMANEAVLIDPSVGAIKLPALRKTFGTLLYRLCSALQSLTKEVDFEFGSSDAHLVPLSGP